jgi:spore coat polysaccharide biosynthesis protein SpsF
MLTNVVAVIQARMGSTRLPGKIMMDVENRPMLWHVVDRLGRCNMLNKVVVATSDRRSDDAVEKFCEKHSFNIFRGDENNVLARYYSAAEKYAADVVVRITGDCPLIDPEVVDKAVGAYLERQADHDGASNIIKRTYPRGLDTEVFSFKALHGCHKGAHREYQREHVTVYMYEHPEIFNIHSVENGIDLSGMRWTVDEGSDLDFVRAIYKRLSKGGKYFSTEDILACLRAEPALSVINEKIAQKNIK